MHENDFASQIIILEKKERKNQQKNKAIVLFQTKFLKEQKFDYLIHTHSTFFFNFQKVNKPN